MGSSARKIIIGVAVAIVAAGGGYFVYGKDVATYDDCIKKGFFVEQTGPETRKCTVPVFGKEFLFREEGAGKQ